MANKSNNHKNQAFNGIDKRIFHENKQQPIKYTGNKSPSISGGFWMDNRKQLCAWDTISIQFRFSSGFVQTTMRIQKKGALGWYKSLCTLHSYLSSCYNCVFLWILMVFAIECCFLPSAWFSHVTKNFSKCSWIILA